MSVVNVCVCVCESVCEWAETETDKETGVGGGGERTIDAIVQTLCTTLHGTQRVVFPLPLPLPLTCTAATRYLTNATSMSL